MKNPLPTKPGEVREYVERATGLHYQATTTKWRKQIAVGSKEWTEWTPYETEVN